MAPSAWSHRTAGPLRRAARHLRRAGRHLRDAAHLHPHADIAVAVTLFTVTLVTTAAGPQDARGRLSASAVLLAAVACGVLAVRRKWPFPVLVVSTAAAEAYLVPHWTRPSWLILGAPLIALYTVAENTGRRRALLVGGLVVLAVGAVHTFAKPAAPLGPENLALAALGGLAMAAGDASRHRRAYLAEVEERARRAEGDREREARRRVTEERLRIARDLHDRVGHHLALINVQAGVAAHVLESQTDQVRQSLAHIRQASRSALDELRDTIGVLRVPGQQEAPTEPTVGLAALGELVASFRRSGLRIDERVDGEARTLTPAADVTAYRVIQESLTNVCKHAGTPFARLSLDFQPAALHIVVDNECARTPAGGGKPGHGLLGMSERVAALGGDLRAAHRPDGGFRLAVTLPLPASGAA
jgi:signal transduction histidine kinase